MRKLLVAALFLLLLVALGLPGAVGWLLAREVPRFISSPQADFGAYEVSLLELERGWFSSRYLLQGVAGGRPRITLAVEARHGPWTGARPGWVGGGLELSLDDVRTAQGAFRVPLRGGARLRAYPIGELGSGEAVIEFAPSGTGFELVLRALEVRPWVDGLTGRIASDRASEGAWWEADLGAARLTVSGTDSSALSLAATGARAGDDGTLDLTFTAGELAVAGADWRDLELELAMQQLHTPTLANLWRALQSAARTPMTAEQRQQVVVGSLFSALPALLLNQPAIPRLQVRGEAPRGDFSVEGEARLLRPPPAAFINDFSRLLEVLSASVDARFAPDAFAALVERQIVADSPWPLTPVELARRRDLLVEDLRRQGWLPRAGTDAAIELRYEPGRLLVNGEERRLAGYGEGGASR